MADTGPASSRYILGLRDLGHDVFWLDLLPSRGMRTRDERLIAIFFRRLLAFGLGDRCAVLLLDEAEEQDLVAVQVYGVSKRRLVEIFRSADLLWNFACGLRQPLLSLCRRRVLVDGDPGHLQVSAMTCDLGLHDQGLLVIRDTAEALAGIADIDRDYDRHRRAARRLAEDVLDSRRCLGAMLAACGW